jgi:hypothetical protein
MPARLFSYPYGGDYLRVDYARRRFGYPYVGFYYGNYYAPDYAYSYAPPSGITMTRSTRVTTATAAIATALAAVDARIVMRGDNFGQRVGESAVVNRLPHRHSVVVGVPVLLILPILVREHLQIVSWG